MPQLQLIPREQTLYPGSPVWSHLPRSSEWPADGQRALFDPPSPLVIWTASWWASICPRWSVPCNNVQWPPWPRLSAAACHLNTCTPHVPTTPLSRLMLHWSLTSLHVSNVPVTCRLGTVESALVYSTYLCIGWEVYSENHVPTKEGGL